MAAPDGYSIFEKCRECALDKRRGISDDTGFERRTCMKSDCPQMIEEQQARSIGRMRGFDSQPSSVKAAQRGWKGDKPDGKLHRNWGRRLHR